MTWAWWAGESLDVHVNRGFQVVLGIGGIGRLSSVPFRSHLRAHPDWCGMESALHPPAGSPSDSTCSAAHCTAVLLLDRFLFGTNIWRMGFQAAACGCACPPWPTRVGRMVPPQRAIVSRSRRQLPPPRRTGCGFESPSLSDSVAFPRQMLRFGFMYKFEHRTP
jgi:hypothetical protein